MKRLFLIFALTSFVFGMGFNKPLKNFYVSPTGSDANPGSIKKPFQTIEKARDTVRMLDSREGVTVTLLEGRYYITDTIEFNETDSGTSLSPVLWKAATGANVIFDGGLAISSDKCTIVSDNEVIARFLPESANKIMQINLKALGITEYGELGPRGFGRPYKTAPMELFVDGEPMNTSRWPNVGRVKMGKVIDPGSVPRFDDFSNRGGEFEYNTDRAKRWAYAKDMYITGIFAYGYADDTVKVAKLDLEKGTIKTVQPHLYGFGGKGEHKGMYEWAALNLIEEIDEPGEYAVDRESGILYFYPKSGVSKSTFQVSMIEEPMLAIEGAKFLTFGNITFENARGSAVYIEGGDSNIIAGCTFRNLGLLAIQMGYGAKSPAEGKSNAHGNYEDGFSWENLSRAPGSIHAYSYDNTAWNRNCGTNHKILSCNIYNIGCGGIILGGGDRKTLTPGNNAIINCDISEVNRWDKIYKCPVDVFGVANKIVNNHLHHCAGQAILLHGNDHIIQYNEMDHVVQDASDQAAIYMGRDPSEAGNMICYNFFHDIRQSEAHKAGWGVQAIFFDDYSVCSATVEGNVFYKAGSSSVVKYYHGGNSYIQNNIMVDCPRGLDPLHATTKGLREFLKGDLMQKRLHESVNVLAPPYSDKYPDLVKLVKEEKELEWPYERNYEVKGDYSQFVDAENMNFNLIPDSKVYTEIEGFEPIPFDKMGLYKDQYREVLK